MAWEIVVGSSDENADIHRLLPLTEEPECDSSIWIDSSEDIRERIVRFRGDNRLPLLLPAIDFSKAEMAVHNCNLCELVRFALAEKPCARL